MQSQNFVHKSTLDFHIVSCNDGLVTLQMQVPEQFATTIPSLLSSLLDTFRLVSHRTKSLAAQARSTDPVEREKRMAAYRQYAENILKKYDSFISKGQTVRQAIHSTRDFYKAQNIDVLCYTIQEIARKNGRFRKKK